MGPAGPSVPVGRRGGLGQLGPAEHLGGGASRRTGHFLNRATVLIGGSCSIPWIVVPSTFGLEGVAHRRPQSGGDGKPVGGTVGGGSEPAGLAAAIHVWTLWRETPRRSATS